MTMTARPRVPIAPAVPHIRAHNAYDPASSDKDGLPAMLARLLDVDRRTVHRWLETDELPEDQADRLAARLGVHPLNLWPELAELPGMTAAEDVRARRRARAQRRSARRCAAA